jgi:sensor c-di-GMP phosphodiesterase-like protein
VVLAASLLGAGLARWLSRTLQLRAGRADLASYADRLVKSGEALAEQTDQMVAAISGDRLEFCSDQELAFMRELVFAASNVKDVGRTRGRRRTFGRPARRSWDRDGCSENRCRLRSSRRCLGWSRSLASERLEYVRYSGSE